MKAKKLIDLNCDMGESFGSWTMGNDAAIMPYVSSVNIACGFHAGDPIIMMNTIDLAIPHGVNIGAHPGYPDLAGFGRRHLFMSPKEVYAAVLYQIGALSAIARARGAELHHVKPHGALYNLAAKDRVYAEAIADAIYAFDSSLILYGLSGSELTRAGKEKGLSVFHEVFADRTYQADASLTPRTEPNAILKTPEEAVDQIIRILQTGEVITRSGHAIPIEADSICIHGDHEGAAEFAKQIYQQLTDFDISIR